MHDLEERYGEKSGQMVNGSLGLIKGEVATALQRSQKENLISPKFR